MHIIEPEAYLKTPSRHGARAYGIVFCDIDGTLLDSQHRITEGTRRKVRELDAAGIPFILVSARMPSGILPIQAELGITTPIVCYSGGLILAGSAALASVGIQSEAALAVKEFMLANWKEISCSAYSFHDWVVDDIRDPWVVQERDITGSEPVERRFAEFFADGRQAHKFLCMGRPDSILALNSELAQRFPKLAVYRSKDTYLEIMSGEASKSGAVRTLCAKYNVPIELSVAFGDHLNDADMLKTAGLGFAMGNAHDLVKQAADMVTLDNDHEGVLAGLEGLLFRAI